ncbi:hypothetical protein MJO28_001204 [Puccinia striiformis f. sp. tritici]|uniref:Uncharacterized protein n=2 Tax=Puccinia striiformis f. sp. tritici TaxID=168172 RepID=A0ACC0EU31_9BASI|nr:hypothetical protein MJO28_001627 [Puccinia striiformis f. sp. tritici]KAI7963110.1 hypothetical protein MJO28_001204 [Puccinia striiformis f. sp. tritici]
MARGSNWHEEEDAQLARSWLHTSQNPIHSNSMKRDDFWKKAAVHFKENTSGHDRVWSSLRDRWALVRLACTRFCGIFNGLERNPPSGHGTLDFVAQAKTMFKDQTKKPFTMERAWLELKDKPKWKATLKKTPDPILVGLPVAPTPDSPSTTQPNTLATGDLADTDTNASTNGGRPIGIKGAKRALTQAEFMGKKLKLMETAASDTRTLAKKRSEQMTRANDLQEKVVNMEILSKDLSTCIDEYERAFYTQAKKDIIADLAARRANPVPQETVQPESQAESSDLPALDLDLLTSEDNENQSTPERNNNPCDACDDLDLLNNTVIDPALE